MKSILLIPIVLLLSCKDNRYEKEVSKGIYIEDSLMSVPLIRDTLWAEYPLHNELTDSTKIWFQQYLKLKRKGRVDSLNPYYKKLMHK